LQQVLVQNATLQPSKSEQQARSTAFSHIGQVVLAGPSTATLLLPTQPARTTAAKNFAVSLVKLVMGLSGSLQPAGRGAT
jgi:hypothetical protein